MGRQMHETTTVISARRSKMEVESVTPGTSLSTGSSWLAQITRNAMQLPNALANCRYLGDDEFGR